VEKEKGMRLGTFNVENLFDRAAAMVNNRFEERRRPPRPMQVRQVSGSSSQAMPGEYPD
jgi:hypothetical protein